MSNMRTINALYPPYHTLEAIHRAEFADSIPIPSSGFNILAVHPIPETWLRDKLTPQERQDLRNHVVAVLSSNKRISENEKFVVVVATTLENIDKLGNYTLSDDSESSDDKSDDIRSDHGLYDRNHTYADIGPTANHGPCQVRYPGIDVFAPGTTPPRRAPSTPTQVVPPRIIPQIHPDGHYYLPQHFDIANSAPTYSPAGRAHDQEHEAEAARRKSSGPSRKSSRKPSRKSSRRGRSQQSSHRPEDRSFQSEVEESRRPSSGRSRNSSLRGCSQHSSRRPDNRSGQSSHRSDYRPRLPSLPSEAGPRPITGSTRDQELLEHETGVTRCAERLQRCEHEVQTAQRALQQEQIRGLAYGLNLIPLFRAKPVQPEMGDCVLRDNNEVLRLNPSGKWHRYLEPYNADQGGVYLAENA